MALINSLIWVFVTLLILFIGSFFSFKLKGIQFRFFSMFKSLLIGDNRFSSFGLLMTSLAGKIGVGSIAGVCLSIYIGGVGSLFWMWVSTFFCAIITYAECVLGVKYRVSSHDEFYGGPSYYIRDGLNNRFLGGIYAFLIIVSYVGCFLGIQANTITRSLVSVLSFSPYVIASCIVVFTFFSISGGFRQIVSVSEKMVPIMFLIYIGSAMLVGFKNFDVLGNIFADIFLKALNVKSFLGGFIPMVIVGIERGIFSNEAGIGTSAIVVASGDDIDYSRQGMIQMLGIYITTILICTSTAIILLTSDYTSINFGDLNGIELASYAFKYHFGSLGTYILVISVILFSFSTIVTGYYYGESSFKYFFLNTQKKYIYILRFFALLLLFLGCILPARLLWNIVDIMVGILILINLYAVWKLRDKID